MSADCTQGRNFNSIILLLLIDLLVGWFKKKGVTNMCFGKEFCCKRFDLVQVQVDILFE